MRLWLASVTAFIVAFGSSSLFAQSVSNVSPPSVEHEAYWATSFVFAFMSSWVIDWLKRHPRFGVLSRDTEAWIQRTIAIVVAVGASLGIGYHYDSATSTLMITGINAHTIIWSGWEAFKQFVMQEFAYRTSFKGHKTP